MNTRDYSDDTDAVLAIAATDLVCDAGGSGADAVSLRDDAIEYNAELDDRIPGARLFWGPYAELDAGVYTLAFIGRIDGALTVDFAHQGGNKCIGRVVLADFSKPACLVVTKPVGDFEVRGIKTDSLCSLRLEAILVHRVYAAPKAPGAQ